MGPMDPIESSESLLTSSLSMLHQFGTHVPLRHGDMIVAICHLGRYTVTYYNTGYLSQRRKIRGVIGCHSAPAGTHASLNE